MKTNRQFSFTEDFYTMAYINYMILDAARTGNGINTARSFGTAYLSLFAGKSEEELSDVAPYIFSYNPKSDFADWFMEAAWGKGWGIMLRSGVPLEELHQHCRKFLVKENDSGQEFYFRYYDPRVLSIFLPTCSPEQLKEFFGPIDYIMIEDIDPNFAQLIWLENYRLFMKSIGKEELLRRFRAHDQFTGEQSPQNPEEQSTPQPVKKQSWVDQNNTAGHSMDSTTSETISSDAPSSIEDNAKKWKEFFFD